MKSMATAARTIGDMFQGKLPYDANAFKAAAELVHARSGRALLDDFPPGSIDDHSQANAQIWLQWDEFQILAGRLSILAAALAADAGKSPAVFQRPLELSCVESNHLTCPFRIICIAS
jgi:cytochrome c556